MKDLFKKQLFINIGIIVGSLAVASLGLFLLADNISATATSIASARTAVLAQADTIDAFSNLKEAAPTAANDQAAMDKLLVSQDGLIVFPTQVDSLGRADGVSTDFSFSTAMVAATLNTPGTVGFTMDVTGPLPSIIAFMKDFESAAPILLSRIDSFSMTGDGTTYTLSAEGDVFFK